MSGGPSSPPSSSSSKVEERHDDDDHLLSIEVTAASAASPERRSHWWRSAAVIAGEIMGTGVLSLPYACARLGWAVGLFSSLFFGCTAIYSGRLLSTCKNRLYPDATSFSDLARHTGGDRFAKFTRAALMTGWAMILPYYIVAAASALAAAFPAAGMCYWHWSLVVMALMAPALQLRSLHGLSILSGLSTAAILVVLLCLVPGLIQSAVSNPHSQVGVPGGQPFFKVYGSLGAFIFAYQGQSMMLEIMREMKSPADFPKALYTANGLMMTCYTLICAIAYGTHGVAIQPFLPDALDPGPTRSVVGVLLAFHTAVSYLLTGQPLHRNVHLMIWPKNADGAGMQTALQWGAITCFFLITAFFIANAVPFFADFQDLLGNLIGASTVFGWPAFFFLRGMRRKGYAIARVDLAVCASYLLVFVPAFTLLGTVNSVLHIIDDWQHSSTPPFECVPSPVA
jgi:proton-coupled amino acid transporter